jgi:hypothetical protein
VHRTLTVAALLSLAACTVERTPDDVLNPRDPSQVERRDAEQDVAIHVNAFLQALARGDRGQAVSAMSPVTDAYVMGVDGNDGRARFGTDGLAAAIAELEIPANSLPRTPDLRVQADPRRGTAWFAGFVEMFPASGEQPERVRMSGVFGRQEGEWRLVQIHISRPGAPPAPVPAPDSAATARDSSASNPDSASAAAPPAGE